MPSAQASADPRPVREHLERILSGTAFAGSERASTFLRHVVEHQLCLPGTPIKESTIGIAVFDKEPGFDPKVDPIVRIYAGRVRQRLERYYETEGRNDSLRIVLPKGSYVPEFHTNSPASIKKIHALPLRMGRVWPWKPLGAAALLAVAVYLGVRWVAPRRKPAPAVR